MGKISILHYILGFGVDFSFNCLKGMTNTSIQEYGYKSSLSLLIHDITSHYTLRTCDIKHLSNYQVDYQIVPPPQKKKISDVKKGR